MTKCFITLQAYKHASAHIDIIFPISVEHFSSYSLTVGVNGTKDDGTLKNQNE